MGRTYSKALAKVGRDIAALHTTGAHVARPQQKKDKMQPKPMPTHEEDVESPVEEIMEELDGHPLAGVEVPPEVSADFWSTIAECARCRVDAIKEDNGWE